MCGISGLVGNQKNKELNIERMKDRMLHRGPDSEGTYISPDGRVALGHRRLSIVDITPTGAQPMTSHDGRYVCVFNGEIYNHRKLKQDLINDPGINISTDDFVGTSDTETLLELISAYGIKDAIQKTKGMFGIAVFDTVENCLYLVRDRIGEKPLYYGFVDGGFAFASDIGSLGAIDGFDNEINTEVLDLYFVHGYIPAPYSVYKDIYKLIPGTILKIKAPFTWDDISLESYYDIKEVAKRGQSNPFNGSFTEAVDELERLLKNSIKDQMVADVPVGAFLSAGIDSSTVVALMQSLNQGTVRTFTIGMDNPEFNEALYAKEIAKHLGTEHTELYISENDAKNVIPKLSYMFGEPFADSSQIPTYLVSKMTREHVTVSLSGDGGDELFAGYTSYRSVERIWNKLSKVPYIVRGPVSSVSGGLFGLLNHRDNVIRSMLLGAKGPESLYNISRNCENSIGKIALNKNKVLSNNDTIATDYLGETNHDLMLMDMMMYHPDDILVKVDRTAMAVSLETRVPMLDKDVVDFAWTLPIEYLRNESVGKLVLRECLYRYVPKELMERPKKGFAIPIEKWLKDDKELRQWAEELLNPKLLKKQNYLNADIVQRMWHDFIDNNVFRPQIWYVLMFQSWLVNKDKKIIL